MTLRAFTVYLRVDIFFKNSIIGYWSPIHHSLYALVYMHRYLRLRISNKTNHFFFPQRFQQICIIVTHMVCYVMIYIVYMRVKLQNHWRKPPILYSLSGEIPEKTHFQ